MYDQCVLWGFTWKRHRWERRDGLKRIQPSVIGCRQDVISRMSSEQTLKRILEVWKMGSGYREVLNQLNYWFRSDLSRLVCITVVGYAAKANGS